MFEVASRRRDRIAEWNWRVTARLDSTQEMAIESAAKAHMLEMADSEYERNLDSKVAILTSRFQCGQSGEELENRFAEISARLEAEQQILSQKKSREVRGAWRIQFQDG